MNFMRNFALPSVLGVFVLIVWLFPWVDARAQDASQIKENLKKQIEELESEITETQTIANTVSKEIDVLTNNIKKQELEIRQLNLAVQKTKLDITDTESQIGVLTEDMERDRTTLAETIVLLDQYDQDSLVTLLLRHRRLSDFFNSVNQIENFQNQMIVTLERIKEEKADLEDRQVQLEQQNIEQSRLRSLEETQKRALDANKKQKQTVLTSTQQQITSKKKDLGALKSQLFYLEQTGVSIDDAVNFAQFAAERAGIRPQFLLALLEVETGRAFQEGQFSVGSNLGTGNWNRDMYQCYIDLGKRASAERQKAAFFEITEQLNYDPDKMPVSRRPSYGCGGAMGPAQFLPSTWLLFESRVAASTGHNPPDPWKHEDAFTAAAFYLADAGATAKTAPAERRAAKAYISGNPNCSRSICNIYSNNIASLTAVIGRSLGV